MSKETVEIVRQIYDEWRRGNFEAGTEHYDPYVLLVLQPEFPDAGTYCGLDEIRKYMRLFLGSWEHAVMKAEEFLDAGDSVVVGVHQQATGKGSGVPVEMHYFTIWTFRGRAAIRIESIRERDAALEAAGLSE